MGSTTVRVSVEVREKLQRMAADYGEPMQDLLAKAVEAYRRQRLLEAINESFAALRADPEAWQEYQEEIKAWDVTLMDGLEDFPYEFEPDLAPKGSQESARTWGRGVGPLLSHCGVRSGSATLTHR